MATSELSAERVVAGWELPLALAGALRSIVAALHDHLAEHGHPEARPAHGFALQAVGDDGPTVAEFARRLAVSKQAAAQMVRTLEGLGYTCREADPKDRRTIRIRRTVRGQELLATSAHFFEQYIDTWRKSLGEARIVDLVADLRLMQNGSMFTDLPALLNDSPLRK